LYRYTEYREDVADLLLTVTRAGHRGGADVRAAVCELPVLHSLLALVAGAGGGGVDYLACCISTVVMRFLGWHTLLQFSLN
jgi:hypothetical protein